MQIISFRGRLITDTTITCTVAAINWYNTSKTYTAVYKNAAKPKLTTFYILLVVLLLLLLLYCRQI